MNTAQLRLHTDITLADLCELAPQSADAYARLVGYLAKQDKRLRKAKPSK